MTGRPPARRPPAAGCPGRWPPDELEEPDAGGPDHDHPVPAPGRNPPAPAPRGRASDRRRALAARYRRAGADVWARRHRPSAHLAAVQVSPLGRRYAGSTLESDVALDGPSISPKASAAGSSTSTGSNVNSALAATSCVAPWSPASHPRSPAVRSTARRSYRAPGAHGLRPEAPESHRRSYARARSRPIATGWSSTSTRARRPTRC